MKEYKEYRLIVSRYDFELSKNVNILLQDGWELHGELKAVLMDAGLGDSERYTQYTQAMKLPKDRKKR